MYVCVLVQSVGQREGEGEAGGGGEAQTDSKQGFCFFNFFLIACRNHQETLLCKVCPLNCLSVCRACGKLCGERKMMQQKVRP